MIPKKEGATASYVLIGAARNSAGELSLVRSVVNRFRNEVTSMDVLYAMSAKKEPAALLPRLAENSAIRADSTISIRKLLDYVNEYFPDALPEGALRHFGYGARPAGTLGESALFQERDIVSQEIATLQRDLRQMRAELLIGNASDGRKYLYGIVNIKENTANALGLRHKEARKGSYKAATQGSVSDGVSQFSGANSSDAASENGSASAPNSKIAQDKGENQGRIPLETLFCDWIRGTEGRPWVPCVGI